jgi:hypothetical protein
LKRRSPFLAALAALALAAPAAGAADRVELKGVGPEPSVSLQLVTVNGKPFKVNKFKFFNIPVQCDGGAALLVTRNKALPAMRVNNRNRFGATFDFQGAEEVTVRGKITDGGASSKGSLRVRGNFTVDGVQYTGCDSGKVKWRAA